MAKDEARSNSKWKVYQWTILCHSGMPSFIIISCLWFSSCESTACCLSSIIRFCYDILYVLGSYQGCKAKAYKIKVVDNISADETCNTLHMSYLDERENICPPSLDWTESAILQAAYFSTLER